MNLTYMQKVRRELGMCVDCGGPLDTPTLIRCAACRKKQQQMVQYAKHRQKHQEEKREEKKRTRVDYTPSRSVCATCVWATYTGGGVYFCPLSVCVRVRLADELKKQDSNAEAQ